jgi:phage terminase large subunit GpA-like protein
VTSGLAIADAATLYEAAFSKGLRPETPISVSQWAERHRIISREGAAEPGPYRIDRTPYMRAIMDALSPDSGWSHVVFIKCAQIGFSEAGNNWVGYCIARDPGPMMVVQPRMADAKDYVKQRLDPMIRDTPEVRARIPPTKSRDGSNTLLQKSFPGGMLFVSIANSAASLASKPIGKLMLDEVDRYPKDVDGEGDPVELAKKRTTTFLRRKILEGSTPTIDGASRIQTSYEGSTKGRFFVPCPFCDEFQVLEWAGVRWEKNPDGSPILSSTRYKCAACGELIQEYQKAEMLRRGEWRHENPKATSIGFHLSGLYSPWAPWSALVEKWVAAQGKPPLLKSFVNTELGECYTLSPEEKDAWAKVYGKREPYRPGVVPARAVLLTAGGDVQKDRLEVSVWSWGRGKQSWRRDPGRHLEGHHRPHRPLAGAREARPARLAARGRGLAPDRPLRARRELRDHDRLRVGACAGDARRHRRPRRP